MSVDLMSFPIFLFLTGAENIFIWFGRVYFSSPSPCLPPPPIPSLTLLSKHSEPGNVAEPCPLKENLSCSAGLVLSTQEL